MISQHEASSLSLTDWLSYLESIHPKNIELGLDRVEQVYRLLDLDFSSTQVITVAGTNGKGTTCAAIEKACLQAGRTVAVYSSPHLLDYRERVRVNDERLSEQAHCAAFCQVEQARGDIPLTYFEFGTLAALVLVAKCRPAVALLEIGLGGRLDAVNIVDPDLAVITLIDIDHSDWLGHDRETIGREKAGILRASGSAIIGDTDCPNSVKEIVEKLQVQALWREQDFTLSLSPGGWHWQGKQQFSGLPDCAIPPANLSVAMAVCEWLALPLASSDWQQLIPQISLPGRCQTVQLDPKVVLDVAHNPQACGYLADFIHQQQYTRLYCVVGMLSDKDISGAMQCFADIPAQWICASLDVPRGTTAEQLTQSSAVLKNAMQCQNVTEGVKLAHSLANQDDLIVVFGSFFTVAEALQCYQDKSKECASV